MVRVTACRSLFMTVCLFLGLTVLGCVQSGPRGLQKPRGVTVVPTMPPVSPVERRVALVIGNDRYQHVTQLERAVSDAQAVGRALRRLGFEVLAHSNLDREGMIEAIGALVDRIARGGVGMLFFAGHGVQLGGENFLLPIDVKAARADDLPDKAMALGRVMERLAQAQAKFTLLILDACRDNPFPKAAGRTIGGPRGLTIPAAPNGLMVIYSAGINEQALDRLSPRDTDPNGLFTREFLKYLPQPGLQVDDMLKRVRGEVRTKAAAIGHAQNPAIYDQSSGDFYFVIEETGAHPGAPVPTQPSPATTSGNDDAVEFAFWNSVKDAKPPDALDAYLQQYPQGKFSSLARLKLKELTEPPKPPVEPPVTPEPVDIEEGSSETFLNNTLAIGVLGVGEDKRGYFANITISTLKKAISVRPGQQVKLPIGKQDYVVRIDKIIVRSTRRDGLGIPVQQGIVSISITKI